MSEVVRDLVFMSPRRRTSVQDALDTALAAWCAHWMAGSAAMAPATADRPVFVLQAADELVRGDEGTVPALAWQPDHQAPTASVWWRQAQDTAQRLAALLLGRPTGASAAQDDWAVAVAADAIDDLRQRCLGALGLQGGHGVQPPGRLYETAGADVAAAEWLLPYSGALVATLPPWGLQCLLTPQACGADAADAVAVPAARADVVAPMASWLQQQPIGLCLELGSIEVTVDDLLALRSGDVVRFPARLEDPLKARLTPATTMPLAADHAISLPEVTLSGDLGQLGDRLALQLVAAVASSTPPSLSNARKSAS